MNEKNSNMCYYSSIFHLNPQATKAYACFQEEKFQHEGSILCTNASVAYNYAVLPFISLQKAFFF